MLQTVAGFLPAYHLSQLALKVVSLDIGESVGKHLAILMLYGLVFFGLALSAYTKQDKS